MNETQSDSSGTTKAVQGSSNEVKWDYTSREGTLFTGALVVGLNLLVIIVYALYQTIPAVHSFFSGKPA